MLERSGEGRDQWSRLGGCVAERGRVESRGTDSENGTGGCNLLLSRVGLLAAVCSGLVLLVEAGPISPQAGAALTSLEARSQGARPARREAASDFPVAAPRSDGPRSKADIEAMPWPEDGLVAAGTKLAPAVRPSPEPAPQPVTPDSFLQALPALRDTSFGAVPKPNATDADDVEVLPGGLPDLGLEEPSFASAAVGAAEEHGSNGVEAVASAGYRLKSLSPSSAVSDWLRPVMPASEEERYCLSLTIYFEARGEPELGKLGVAHVVMNRVADGRFPDSICRVVQQGGAQALYRCQFTWWCDGLSDRPANIESWEASRALAERVYWGETEDPTRGALWYHADYVAPRWAMAYRRTSQIGRHIFYQPTLPERRLAARGS